MATQISAQSAPVLTAGAPMEQDWRFAELVARTWIEPALSTRYQEDPHAVLADFGLHLPSGCAVPLLPPAPALDLVVEDFGAVGVRAGSCSQCTSCTVCVVSGN